MTKYLNDEYRDRGMKKWGGFFLSEHSSEQEIYAQKQLKINSQKPQMETYEIGRILQEAKIKNRKIAIQLEAVDSEGNYYDDVIGFLKGADSMGIYVENEKIHYDEIRNVELVDHMKWSE